MSKVSIDQEIQSIAEGARAASRVISSAGSAVKDKALEEMAKGLKDQTDTIIEENKKRYDLLQEEIKKFRTLV